jgi:sarcosine oxidase delta subunit
VLFALSVAHAEIYSAEDAPADGAPYACPRCLSPVYVRNSPHQRPHWVHMRGVGRGCHMRRDAVSSTRVLALRTATEINHYAPDGA